MAIITPNNAPYGWSHLGFWKHRYGMYREKLKQHAKDVGYEITPHESNWFKAYEMVPSNQVKVVILGQEPYPDGSSTGLAFDVNRRRKHPPASLRVIIDEYCSDLGYPRPRYNTLKPWAENGVLLLNSLLTARRGYKGYHRNRFGWEMLVYETLSYLSYQRPGIVWMLWGHWAKDKRKILYRQDKHLILESDHPSPLASFTGKSPFRGSAPFSKACDYLGVDHSFWRLT